MMFLSLYTILLVLVQVKVNGEEDKSAELSDTMCTFTYPVSHDRKAPHWKKYLIATDHNDSATAQTCQDYCSAHVKCESVTHWTKSNKTYCSMYKISVQELKDMGREKDIITYYNTQVYPTIITYDKDCATPSTTTTTSTPVSSTRLTTTPTSTTTRLASTVKTTLPSTSASLPLQILTTSPQTSGGTTTTTEKPEDTTRILIYIISGVCGLEVTVLVALALLIKKKRLSKVNKRLENVESASWISELNGDENIEEESPSSVDQENSSFPEQWPQFCDSNSDRTESPPEYSEDLDTYTSLPSTDTDSPKSLRDVVAQMQ